MDSTCDAMAIHATERKRAQNRIPGRRNAVLRRHSEEVQRVAVIEKRTERTEQARALRAEQEADAARFAAETAGGLARLTGLLRAAAAEAPRDLRWFRDAVPQDAPPTLDDVAAPPRPEWSQYAPLPPRLFGRRRHERSLTAARAEFYEALTRHDRLLGHAHTMLMQEHHALAERRRHAHEAEWDHVAAAVDAGDPDAVGGFAATVLLASRAVRGLIEGGRSTYEAAGRELVLEIDIPDTDIVPTEAAGSTSRCARPSSRRCAVPRTSLTSMRAWSRSSSWPYSTRASARRPVRSSTRCP